MDPKSSLPHSHVPATCLYPELAPFSPRPHIPLPDDTPLYYPSTYTWFFQVVSFPQVSPPKTCIRFSSPHTCYMPRPFHSSRFNHLNNIREQYRSLSSSLCTFLHSPVISSLSGPNILLNTLFSNTLSVRSSFNVKQDLIQKYFLPFKQRQRRQYNVEQ